MLLFLFLLRSSSSFFLFFFNDTATTEIYTLSLHDALPISTHPDLIIVDAELSDQAGVELCRAQRSEEHTSELQSPCNLVCRLLLEKKKKKKTEKCNKLKHVIRISGTAVAHTAPTPVTRHPI